jgi:hypothetical protein
MIAMSAQVDGELRGKERVRPEKNGEGQRRRRAENGLNGEGQTVEE